MKVEFIGVALGQDGLSKRRRDPIHLKTHLSIPRPRKDDGAIQHSGDARKIWRLIVSEDDVLARVGVVMYFHSLAHR